MPAPSEFDLTDPVAWLVAADALEEEGERLPAAVLRGLRVVPLAGPERVEWEDRRPVPVLLPDTRENRASRPERIRADTPRLILYRLPALTGWAAAWVAEVYRRPGTGSIGHTIGPEGETPAAAVVALAQVIERHSLGSAAELVGLPAHHVPIRLASEDRPEWWERGP